MKKRLTGFLSRFWKSNRGLICFLAFVVVPIKSSLADWNWVPSGSMNPTILEGDLVLVNRAAYDLRVPLTLTRVASYGDPERGDIVVCAAPEDGTRLIKRVVAVPGDLIEFREHQLWINGVAADYAPADPADYEGLRADHMAFSHFAEETVMEGESRVVMWTPALGNPQTSFPSMRLPLGQYFIMGDNRDNSRDSRTFGTVPRHLIVGRGEAVILSFDKYEKYRPRFGRWFSGL